MIRRILAARFFLLLMLIGGLDAFTAMAGEAPPALMSTSRNLLEWTPVIDFESITLSLADPQGLVRTHRFGPGEAPVLSLFDAQGIPLRDGTYTWELRVTPRRSAGRSSAPLVQSGYFTMANGNLVVPDLSDPAEGRPKAITSEDQMVPDDLIVDGKGCIGLGCSNNEVFFAEALRLKQSVVRLRFEDTSVAAGLPARDWQLTVNDAASGGADRFSIDDLTAGTTPFTVRGGAPSNSLYVDSTGRLGVGTSTPAQQLHVTGSNGTAQALIQETSGTATIRTLLMLSNNGAVRLNYVDTSLGVTWGANAIAGNYKFIKAGTGVVAFDLQGNGNLTIAGTLTQNSDRAVKKDLMTIAPREVLAKISNLPIFSWNYIQDPAGTRHLGPMAQDFRAAFGLGEDDRHIAPIDLAGVSLAAVQGLHALVEEQRQLIEEQRELIGRLEERLRRLEVQEQPKLESVVKP